MTIETKFLAGDPLLVEYEKRLPAYEIMRSALESELTEILRNVPRIDRISVRKKDTYSFVKKAKNKKYKNPFSDIEDQLACRVIVFFLSDIDVIIDRLGANFNCIESSFKEPAKYSEFGYESHHLVCIIPPYLKDDDWLEEYPTTFELQIRTLLMHAFAEPQHDLGYKNAADLSPSIRRGLSWVAASCWGADKEYQRIVDAVDGEDAAD